MATYAYPRSAAQTAGPVATSQPPLTDADLDLVRTFDTLDYAASYDTLQRILPLHDDAASEASSVDSTSISAPSDDRMGYMEGVGGGRGAGIGVRNGPSADYAGPTPVASLHATPGLAAPDVGPMAPATYDMAYGAHSAGMRAGAVRRNGRRIDDAAPLPPAPESSTLLPDDAVGEDADDDADDDEDGIAIAGPDGKPLRYKQHGLRQLISDLIKSPKHRQWLTGRKGAFNRLTNKILKPVWDQMCKFFPDHCKVDDVSGRGVVQEQRRIHPASPIPADVIEAVIARHPEWNGVGATDDTDDRTESTTTLSGNPSTVISPVAASASTKPSVATTTRAAARFSKWGSDDSPKSWGEGFSSSPGSESSSNPLAPVAFSVGKTPAIPGAYAMPRESLSRGAAGGTAFARKPVVPPPSARPPIPSISAMTRPGGWGSPSTAPFIVPQAHALTRPQYSPAHTGPTQVITFSTQRRTDSDDDLLDSDSDSDEDAGGEPSQQVEHLTTMAARSRICNEQLCATVPPPDKTTTLPVPNKGLMSPPPLPHRTVDYSSRPQVPIVTSDWLKANPRELFPVTSTPGSFAQVPASAFAFPAAAPPVRPPVTATQRVPAIPPTSDAFETSDGEMSVRSVQSAALDLMISELMENQSITDRNTTDLDILSDHDSDHEHFHGVSPAPVAPTAPFTVTGRSRGHLGNVGSSVVIPHGVGVAGEDEVFFAAGKARDKRARPRHGMQSPTQAGDGTRPLERHDSNLSNYRPAPSRRSIVPTVRLTTWLQSNPDATHCFTFRNPGYHYIGSAAARQFYAATHGDALNYHAIDDEFTSMASVLNPRSAYLRFILNYKHSAMPVFACMPENLVLLPCVHMLVNAYQEEDVNVNVLPLHKWQPLTGPDCESGYGLVYFGVGDYFRIGDWMCKVSEVTFSHVTTD